MHNSANCMHTDDDVAFIYALCYATAPDVITINSPVMYAADGMLILYAIS